MILECPSCHARYLVPIGLFAQGGRQVRCARCKTTWHATLPTTIDVFVPLPEQAGEPSVSSESAVDSAAQTDSFDRPVPPIEQNPAEVVADTAPQLPALSFNVSAAWIGWWMVGRAIWFRILKKMIKIALLASIVLAWPVMDRVKIVKAIPELRGVYAFFGLYISHSGHGLAFEQVKSELKYDGGIMRLYVDGIVHNTTDEIQFVPDIMARALGPDRHILQSWWVPSPAPTVAAKGVLPFHTEVNVIMNHTIEDVYLEFYAQDEKSAVAE